MNILRATLLAMRRAVEALAHPADRGAGRRRPLPDSSSVPAYAIIKGDRDVPAISAASIIAKTTRDAMLVALDREYPMYGFARHKGYGTPEHLAALDLHGPCPHHRKIVRAGAAGVVRVLVSYSRRSLVHASARGLDAAALHLARRCAGVASCASASSAVRAPRGRRPRRSIACSRAMASSRLRSWLRYRCALMTMTPSLLIR